MTTSAFDLLGTRLQKGTLLLEASAGTGKTYTIAGIVLRLLLEGVVAELSQVLVVTFTIAATEELKTRLRRAIAAGIAACEGVPQDDPFLRQLGERHGAAGAEVLRKALAAADEMSVSTIHGFCRRVLEEAAFEGGQPFATEFVEDEIPMLADAVRDAVRLEVLARDPLAAAIAQECDLLPDGLLPQYREFRRHAATSLRPVPADLDASLAAAAQALAALRELAAAGDLPGEQIDGLPYKKGCRPKAFDSVLELSTAVRERLLSQDDAAIDLLVLFARDALAERLLQRAHVRLDHAFYGHCQTLAAATATAGHALRARMFAVIDARLAQQKQRTHAVTFQDLLTRVGETLRDQRLGKPLLKSIRSRWQVALIDEFQDTDPLQYEVFASCFGDERLLLVGDPKQSIYGFRGADVHAYLAARDRAVATHTLDENHRSSPGLVRAVEVLFAGRAAFAQDGIALQPVRAALSAAATRLRGDDLPALQLRWLPPSLQEGKPREHNREFAESRIVADVADECVRLLAGGIRLGAETPGDERPLRAGDLAVLTRTNQQAVDVQDELRRRGVHSAIGKAGDVFQCDEMDDMQRLLTALVNPTYLPLLRAAWTTPLFGFDAAQMLALDDQPQELALHLARADQWRRTWFRHGFIVMFQDLLHELDTRSRLLQRSDGERKLTNYLQIAELLHRAELGRQLAPESLLQWLAHERRHAQEIDYELRELRLESDADAVQILTVHGSKGLQYEVVFVPFAWSGRDVARSGKPLLARTADGQHLLCYDGDEREQVAPGVEREALAEDLRLLYVALTRAKRRCYLHWVAGRGAKRSALGFLLLGPGRSDQDPDDLLRPSEQAKAGPPMEQWGLAAQQIAAASDGAIGYRALTVDAPPEPRPALAEADGPRLARPRALPDRVPPGFRIGSFTSMLRHDRAPEPLREQDQLDDADATAPTAATPTGLFAFARGAQAGICLHEVLELCDFAAVDRAAALALAQRTLVYHGLADAAAHRAPIDAVATVADLVLEVAQTPLAPLPFRLADVAAAQRIPEWQFFVSAGRAQPRELAALFAEHASPSLRGYADRLRTLPTLPLQGFLRGFVDLVAEHDGRYYVFDWKSNWLGDAAADYAPAHLLLDMQQNHYVLQYHLYLLALHRHLRARLPDYDYDRHIGGACYVYLRGLGHGDAGICCDRPPRALVERLDAWLADPHGGAR